MIKKIQIWHAILILYFIVLLLRFDELVSTIELIFVVFQSLLSNPGNISNIFSTNVVDQLFSFALFLSGIFFVISFRKKLDWLRKKCSVTLLASIILSFIFLFAPILAPYSDNLQFNLPTAKRLAPLCSRYLVKIIDEQSSESSKSQSQKVEKSLFRENVTPNYYLSETPISNQSSIGGVSTRVIFLLGTDEYGRDILSRIIYATRYSLLIGIIAISITGLIGITLGFISGYFGKYVDILLNRIAEMFLAVPFIFLVILCVAFLGDSLLTVIIVLGVAGWMSLFKIVRSEVLKLKTRDHIVTSQMVGMTLSNQLIKEYLPLLLPAVLTNLTFQFAYIIIAESSLSFLGITGNYSHSSLGGMIQQGFLNINEAWWIILFPTIIITLIFYTVYNYANKLRNIGANQIGFTTD